MKKMKKIKIMSIALMAVFVLSINGQVATVSGQDQFIETNFDVWFYTQAGSRTTESYALYIKQALAPLGINVKIVAKPWGQFVGDLLHYTTGHPFDMCQIRFSGGAPTPSFMALYHSTQTSFGADMYQLNDPDWQEWMAVDSGVTTEEVDALLESIQFELNLVTRKALVTEFNELFMTKLLYDIPVVATIALNAMWKGYGGADNDLWDPQEGIMGSRKLGATWTDATAADRTSNNTHMRLDIGSPSGAEMFDPHQSFDSETSLITGMMQNDLLDFDKDNLAHPGIAWNFYFNESFGDTYDTDNNATTPALETYTYSWFFGQDAMWAATTDADGNPVAAHAVDAEDMVLTYDYMKHPLTVINGKENLDPVLDYYSESTVFTNDTFTIKVDAAQVTPDGYLSFGAWFPPTPAHIVGGDLTWVNDTVTNVAKVSDNAAWNPQLSDEWVHWASPEGHSLAGAYDLVEMKLGEFYAYEARDDYWFPNEDMVSEYYDATAFADLEAEYGWSFDVFAPHENAVTPDNYYWTFAGFDDTQGVETFEYVVIDDINAILLQFEAGNLDAFGSTALGAQTVQSHQSNPNYVVKEVTDPSRGPELIVFNLLNEHLKKIDVRDAIAHVIDKNELVKIHDGFGKPHHSVVKPFATGWIVPHEILYDYNRSRDLMRSQGYKALETPEFIVADPKPPVNEVFGILGSEYLFFVSAVALVSAVGLRKRRN